LRRTHGAKARRHSSRRKYVTFDQDLSYNKGYRKALETVVEILHLISAENPEAKVIVNRIVELLVENATANVKINVRYLEAALAKQQQAAIKKK
jgi:hypothetical protein